MLLQHWPPRRVLVHPVGLSRAGSNSRKMAKVIVGSHPQPGKKSDDAKGTKGSGKDKRPPVVSDLVYTGQAMGEGSVVVK